MKEFKYRSGPKDFKGVKETTYNEKYKRLRRINIPRIIYFLVLIFIGISLIYYFADRSIYVSGKGLVLSDNMQMMVDDDVEILAINVKNGEKVKAGDTLLSYCYKNQAKTGKDIYGRIYKEESSYKSDRKIYSKNIGLKKIKRDHYKRKLKEAQRYYRRLNEEVKLNIAKSADLRKLGEDIASYKLEIHYLDNEIIYLRSYLRKRELEYSVSRESLQTEHDKLICPVFMRTPVAGTIINVLKKKGMPAYRKDPVIEINNGEGVAIVAYFSQRDLHYLKLDNKVKVYFNDGYTSRGSISEISEPMIYYDSTGEPQLSKDMKIKVKISPLDGDSEEWNVRKGYFVKVKRLRNIFN